MRKGTIIAAVGAACLLAACSGGSGDGDTNETSSPEPEAITFADMVDRFGPKDGETMQIEFSDELRIAELAAEDPAWEELTAFGAAGIWEQIEPDARETLGIDLAAAEALFSVGGMPSSLLLMQGGQDEELIVETASESGWSGTETLTLDGDDVYADNLRSHANQLRPLGDSVLVGARTADVARLDAGGETLADDPHLAQLAECVGDAVAVRIVDAGYIGPGFKGTDSVNGAFAVGVLADEGMQSVVCALSDDAPALERAVVDAVKNGDREGYSSQPWAELLTVAETSVDGELLRVVLGHVQGTDPGLLLKDAEQPGPPGFV